MIDSSVVARRRASFFRQAKRLAELLDLPLTTAKSVLARALYRCSGEADLLGRLEECSPGERLELLADLPQSPQACTYFTAKRRELAHSLSQDVLTNSNLARLFDVLREVFAVGTNDKATLSDLLPTLPTTPWVPSGIGPDPEAVLHSEASIGGVAIRVVATRVYMPGAYDFGPDAQPEYAVPYGHLWKIVWTSPDDWRQAALDYIEDQDAEDVVLPEIELTEAMARHQRWFESALEAAGLWCRYGEGDETPVTHVVEGRGCYIVFGFPSRVTSQTKFEHADGLLPDAGEDLAYRVVLIDGTPLCLEWIAFDPRTDSHPGDCGQYFETLRRGLLRHGRLLPTALSDGALGILLIQPATNFHLEQALKVEFHPTADEIALVLKTDDAALATALVVQVADRDLMVFGSEQSPKYVVRMTLSSGSKPRSLSLSLNLVGPSLWSLTNLISLRASTVRDDREELLVVVLPQLLTLVDLLGKKATANAINQGIVLRKPLTFRDELERMPARCQHLPRVSPELAKRLQMPLSGVPRWTRAGYERDNF